MKAIPQSRVFWLLVTTGVVGGVAVVCLGVVIDSSYASGLAVMILSFQIALVYLLLRSVASRTAVSVTRLRGVLDLARREVSEKSAQSDISISETRATQGALRDDLRRLQAATESMSKLVEDAEKRAARRTDAANRKADLASSDIHDELRSQKALLYEVVVSSDVRGGV